MESGSKTSLTSRFPIVKKVDVDSLKKCAELMGPIELGSFDQTYGNIRRLLQLEIQEDAIAAMSQFYDAEIRCFLFKNFQLAPTLEEYEQLLGFSRSDAMPYQFQGKYYSDKKLASMLRISAEKLKLQKIERNGVGGFPQEYFESLMKSYAESKQWGLFKLVLAMTIFGVVLFPQIEKYIDETAIGVFLAFKDTKNPINPVPAVLAETYRAFTRYGEFHKKKMYFSTHVFYAWLLTHIVNNKKEVKELISYALSSDVVVMNSLEWSQNLGKLNDLQIRWFAHACWKERPSVLFQCGSFQNVPLMGTQGCINYNPSLTLRQLGYPMRNSPSEAMLFRFYLFERTPNSENLLRRILQAWQTKVYKGNEELSKKASNITFSQWLQERLQNAKTCYKRASSSKEKIPEPYTPSFEEFDQLKAALIQAEEDKKALHKEVGKLVLEKEKLEEENAIKMIAVEESVKRFKEEEKGKLEAQKYLRSAREEVERCNLKMKKALKEASEWRGLCEKARNSEEVAQTLLAESMQESRMWANQLQSLKRERNSIEDLLKEYQQAVRFEQGRSNELRNHLWRLEEAYQQVKVESKYWEDRFVGLLGRIEDQEIIKELRDEIQHWKAKFSKLAELANRAITDVPKNLRKAEAEMHFLNTPPEVYEFVKFCRTLVAEFRAQSQDAGIGKKRKRVGNFKALCI